MYFDGSLDIESKEILKSGMQKQVDGDVDGEARSSAKKKTPSKQEKSQDDEDAGAPDATKDDMDEEDDIFDF